MIHPTPKAAPKSLDTGGFFGPNFPRVSVLFYAYNLASVFAGQQRNRPPSNTVSGHPGGKAVHRSGKAAFPGRGLRRSAPSPAPDRWAERHPGSSDSMRQSSISPAYSRGRPAVSTHTPDHNSHTVKTPACGSQTFPRGSAPDSYLVLVPRGRIVILGIVKGVQLVPVVLLGSFCGPLLLGAVNLEVPASTAAHGGNRQNE